MDTKPQTQNSINASAPRGFACPICAQNLKVRATQMQTKLVRDMWFLCQNVECAASFKGATILESIISNSAIAHNLPLPVANKSNKNND